MHNQPHIPIYLINLERAPVRLALMEAMLGNVLLPFVRVAAVDGNALQFPIPEFDEAAYKRLHGRRCNPGEVGCYLSHIECARRLLASPAQHALILEDDLSIPDDMNEIIRAAIDAGDDWDILRLSSVNDGKKFPFRTITSTRSLAIALTREKGSGAYIINRRAAQWFVDGLMPMRLPFDIAFDIEHLAGLRAAFIFPVPINQDIGLKSQIQGRRRAFHLSRWRYASVLPYRAWLETSRFYHRLIRLLRLYRQGATRQRSMEDGALAKDDGYLAEMTVPRVGGVGTHRSSFDH